MDVADSWRMIFETWPREIPRNGMLVTTFGETIPFIDFLISGGVLMVERDKPDNYGGRKVMIIYQSISAVKLGSPEALDKFLSMGFQRGM